MSGSWPVARSSRPTARARTCTADQDAWIGRKSATAFCFEASTLLVGLRMEADGRDPFADGWLDSARYTLVAGLR